MNPWSSARSESDPSDEFAFEDLIFPWEPGRFFAEHWESRRLFLERGDPGYYARLFTLDDVDRALHVAKSCPEDVVSIAYPQGSGKKREQVHAAAVSWAQLYQSFCEGCTIRLGGIDRFWPPLALFKAGLAQRLSADVTINMYLTPPSSQGFVAHFDNHDVFIVQLHGAKRWHLGDPLYELPGSGLEHVNRFIPRQTLPNDSPHLDESVVVRAGDLLYLPRGFFHKPVAEEESSLHLTVGIHPVHWGEFLARAIEFVALKHLPLRKSLPPGFASDPEARRGMDEAFAEVLRIFAREAPFEETFESLAREHRMSESCTGDGHFTSLDRLASVNTETVLERRQGLTCRVELRDDTALIYFGSNYVSGPQALAPLFEFVRDNRRFRVGELAGALSDNSKTVLARRLIREGLLRRAD